MGYVVGLIVVAAVLMALVIIVSCLGLCVLGVQTFIKDYRSKNGSARRNIESD